MSEAVWMRPTKRVSQEKKFGLSGSTLKWIAVVTMLIDHVGAAVLLRVYRTNCFRLTTEGLRQLVLVYRVMRAIGRVAFPIYCFLLVEGFRRTGNALKYALRLFLFALISEIPFDLAFHSQILETEYQNVFFTLFFGLAAMIAADAICRRWLKEEWTLRYRILEMVVVGGCTAVAAGMAWLLRTDYSWKGVGCIMIMYLFRRNKTTQIAAGISSFLWENTAFLAFIPIALYNGKRGLKMKYFFYIFYPAHLLVLYFICRLLGIAECSAF